jgi:PTS system nitrogen regulatory IIA component
MQLSDFIGSDAIFPGLKATSKKQLLQELATLAGDVANIDSRRIFEALLQREKLGSTGLGHGVAIPHGKFEQLDKVYGFFGRLKQPVDYDAVDGEPIDLVFLLLAPESAGADHLKALARISRLLRDSSIVKKLRGTDDATGLYAVLTEPTAAASNAA